MTALQLYAVTAIALFFLALYALLISRRLLHSLLALNIMGSSVFLLLVSLAGRSTPPDPVPQAMVITGIVVSIAATALGLALLVRLRRGTPGPDPDEL